jgi:hypothetical protein
MALLPIYSSSIVNYCIYGSIAFFFAFLLYIIIRKTASAHDSYTRVNRIHSRILLLYVFSLTSAALYLGAIGSDLVIALGVGIFIYLSLHYVFVFALIGLCQKSISVRILAIGRAIETDGQVITVPLLAAHMQSQGADIDALRHSRLGQMTHLHFAASDGHVYAITRFGRLVDHIGTTVLKVYGLQRL